MSIRLPEAVAFYVAAENAGDVESLSECFAPDATVRDERRTHKGLDAINAWRAETKRRYNHTVAPLEVAERDGKTVLKARLTGTFPGSPVTLEFAFTLEEGRITLLEIE
jgi:SnoaL-like domain